MAKTLWKAFGFKKLKGISFGLVTALFLLWAMFNSSSFVPEGLEKRFFLTFMAYGLLGVYIFGRHDLRAKLQKISLIKALPYFLFTIAISFFVVSFFLGIVDPLPQTLIATLIGVPFYLQLVNALIFGVVEGSLWQGHLDEKIGIFGSVIVAGFFHMFIWEGNFLVNFIGASVLFLFFSVSYYFLKKRFSVVIALVISIGIHVGYNLAKYRMIFGT